MNYVDAYLDDLLLTAPVHSNPKMSTTITVASSGDEGRNRNWQHPLRSYSCAEAVRDQPTFEAIQEHWFITGGPFLSFPFTDPLDFATVGLAQPSIGPNDPEIPPPETSGTDQIFGVGDGFTRVFQLTKQYTRPIVGGGQAAYLRPIYLPQLDSVELLMNPGGLYNNWYAPGAVPVPAGGPYTAVITRPGGQVTFTPAPTDDCELGWGGYFDVIVRFETDDAFAGIVQAYRVSGFAAVNFVETRFCQD
ncbi:MAG TPA: DUF2460 domain-containing protein [Caulobacteraceae bacterium]